MTRPAPLSLSQLRAFEAVARLGGVSAAATEIGVAPPSVSTQLRALEQAAGAALFVRAGKGFALTALGTRILGPARAALALVRDVERLLGHGPAAVLRIGYSAHPFAMPAIAAFSARHPGVRIAAVCLASGGLLDRVAAGELDVAMVTAPLPFPPRPGLRAHLLRQDRIVLALPATHALARRDTLPWITAAGLPLIRREPASGTRAIFDAAAQAAGATLRPVLEVGSWSSMTEAVSAGIGAGLVLEGEIAAAPQLAPIAIDDPALIAGHYLITPEGLSAASHVADFLALATTLAPLAPPPERKKP